MIKNNLAHTCHRINNPFKTVSVRLLYILRKMFTNLIKLHNDAYLKQIK